MKELELLTVLRSGQDKKSIRIKGFWFKDWPMKINGMKTVLLWTFLCVWLLSYPIFWIVLKKKETFISKSSRELLTISEINQWVSFGLRLEITLSYKISFLFIQDFLQFFWSILSEESFQWWNPHSLSKTLKNGLRTFSTEREEGDLDSILNHWPLEM